MRTVKKLVNEPRLSTRFGHPAKTTCTLNVKGSIIKNPVVKNISGSGMSIIIDKKLRVGHALDIKLKLPGDKRQIHAISRVVWVKKISTGKYHTGIKHLKVVKKDRDRFMLLVCEFMLGICTKRVSSGA